MDYLPLERWRRGFTLRALVSSSITHRVLSLGLHLPSLNLCLLFSAMDVILIGLDCLPILFITCVHFPHTSCLSYSLNWLFCTWRSKRSRVFYTLFELSYSLSKVLNIYFFTLCNNFLNFFSKKPLVATSSKGKKINFPHC